LETAKHAAIKDIWSFFPISTKLFLVIFYI